MLVLVSEAVLELGVLVLVLVAVLVTRSGGGGRLSGVEEEMGESRVMSLPPTWCTGHHPQWSCTLLVSV